MERVVSSANNLALVVWRLGRTGEDTFPTSSLQGQFSNLSKSSEKNGGGGGGGYVCDSNPVISI
jgi:hypothetical protein